MVPERRRERLVACGHSAVGKNCVLPHLVNVPDRAFGDLAKLAHEAERGINIVMLHGYHCEQLHADDLAGHFQALARASANANFLAITSSFHYQLATIARPA
jgi:hypothetical protein